MRIAGMIICGFLLAGCAKQTANTPPPSSSPQDQCRQAMQDGDTRTITEKCNALMRDQ